MITRSEIYKRLSDSLSDSVWQQLKKSVLGKELLAFGTEVIFNSETVKQSLIDSLDYTKASFSELIQLASISDVCVSEIEPSYIRLVLPSTSPTVIYPPFDLSFTVGNIKFTNITYCKSGDTVTLYQGLVKTMYTGSYQNAANFNSDVQESWTVTTLSDDDIITRYLRLGDALPESVYLFNVSSAGAPFVVSKFNPQSYGSDISAFKLRTLSDGAIAAELGDGIWAKNFTEGDNWQINWLSLTNTEFDESSGILSSSLYGEITNFVINSSYLGSTSLSYARENYHAQILKNSVISSLSDVVNYVNSFPYVLDSNAVLGSNGVIKVFIKPKVISDASNYREIAASLELYGLLYSTYIVTKGTPIYFAFSIQGIPESIRTNVQEFLETQFSYSNLSYKLNLDPSSVSGLLQSNFGYNSLVTFYVNQNLSTNLFFYPILGTIKLSSSIGSLLAWDQNGSLYGKTTKISALLRPCFLLNNNLTSFSAYHRPLSSPTVISDYFLYNLSSLAARNSTNDVCSLFGVSKSDITDKSLYTIVISTNGAVCLYMGSTSTSANFTPKLAIVPEEQFWNYPDVKYSDFVPLLLGSYNYSTIVTMGMSYNPVSYIEDYAPTFLYYDYKIFWVSHLDSTLTLRYGFLNGEEYELYFALPINRDYSGSDCKGLYRKGDDLLMFLSGFSLQEVNNFVTYGTRGETSPLGGLYDITPPEGYEDYTDYRVYFSGEKIFLIIWDSSNHDAHFFICDGIQTEGTCEFINPVELTDLGDVIPMYCGSSMSVSWSSRVITSETLACTGFSNDIVIISAYIQSTTSSGSSTWYPVFKIDLTTGKATYMDTSPTFYSIGVVGSVDYINGTITYPTTYDPNKIKISYESSSYKDVPEDSYLTLSSTPVSWK